MLKAVYTTYQYQTRWRFSSVRSLLTVWQDHCSEDWSLIKTQRVGKDAFTGDELSTYLYVITVRQEKITCLVLIPGWP
jgi:hypothetical protein